LEVANIEVLLMVAPRSSYSEERTRNSVLLAVETHIRADINHAARQLQVQSVACGVGGSSGTHFFFFDARIVVWRTSNLRRPKETVKW
jgi:hypothetical protein